MSDGTLILHPSDNVAVLTAKTAAGATPLGSGAPLEKPLQAGHKIARADLAKGDSVLKFGQVIGYATEAIPMGAQVHTHNCAFGDHDKNYEIGVDLEAARAAIPKPPARDLPGLPPQERPGRHAQLHRALRHGELLGHGRAPRRRHDQRLRPARRLPEHRRRGGVQPRHRLRDGHQQPRLRQSPARALGPRDPSERRRGGLHRPRLRGDAGRADAGAFRRERPALPRPDDPGDRRHHENGRADHRDGHGTAPWRERRAPRTHPRLGAEARPAMRRIRWLFRHHRQPGAGLRHRPSRRSRRHRHPRGNARDLRRRTAPAAPRRRRRGGGKAHRAHHLVGTLHRDERRLARQQPLARQQGRRPHHHPREIPRRGGQGRHHAAHRRPAIRRDLDQNRLRLHGQPRLRSRLA